MVGEDFVCVALSLGTLMKVTGRAPKECMNLGSS